MSPRTIFLSKLIGLYFILVVPSLMMHRQATVDSMTSLLHNPSLMFILWIITIVAALAMVLAHNLWSSGALAAVVTIVGWLTLTEGLLFLFLPSAVDTEFILRALGHPLLFYVVMAPSLAIGVYLTYGGFTSKSHS